jgi:hypothetical protein
VEEIERGEEEGTCGWDNSSCDCRGDWLTCVYVYLGRGEEGEAGDGIEEGEIQLIQEEEGMGDSGWERDTMREREICKGDQSCRCEMCRDLRRIISIPTGVQIREIGEGQIDGDHLGAVGGREGEEELVDLKKTEDELEEYGEEDVEVSFHIGNMYNYEEVEEGAGEGLPGVRGEELREQYEGEEREGLPSLTEEEEEELSSRENSEENLEGGRRMGMGMRIRMRMNNCGCM